MIRERYTGNSCWSFRDSNAINIVLDTSYVAARSDYAAARNDPKKYITYDGKGLSRPRELLKATPLACRKGLAGQLVGSPALGKITMSV